MIRGQLLVRGAPLPKNPEVGVPRTHGLPVLARHGLDDLLDVTEIVHDPRGEKVAQSHGAEFRMSAGKVELLFSKIERAKRLEVLAP